MTLPNRSLAHENALDVEAGAEAGVNSLFSLGGDAGRSWSTKAGYGVESVYICQDGCDDISPMMPSPSSAVDIKEAVNISRQVQQPKFSLHRGSPKIALLKHYRYVEYMHVYPLAGADDLGSVETAILISHYREMSQHLGMCFRCSIAWMMIALSWSLSSHTPL